MKAMTLYEPWASLMAVGAKVNETRSMRTSHRGDICIHAALNDTVAISEQVSRRAIKAFQDRGFGPMASFGCIVAVVDLWDVQSAEMFKGVPRSPELMLDTNPVVFDLSDEERTFGNYEPGRFIYRTRNLRRLKEPVLTRGYQSIGWPVPEEIEALVLAQIGEITPSPP